MNLNRKCMIAGIVAGLASTAVIELFRKGTQKFVPTAEPPIQQHPGKFMVRRTEKLLPQKLRWLARKRVRGRTESAVANVLGAGYGAAFGSLLPAVPAKNVLCGGVSFGLLTWSAGYLGWLPATGLMPPVWKQKPKQIIAPLIEHALYGVTAVASYRWLMKRFDQNYFKRHQPRFAYETRR